MFTPFFIHWYVSVVPLKAITEKVAVPDNGTVMLAGWTMITGGVPLAKQVLKISRLMKTKQIAAFITRQSKNGLFLKRITQAK